VAHLGHLEVLTPKPEDSLRFFVDVLGMTESGRQGDSVYLRGWDDYERYSLQLTGSRAFGLGHAAFRARSPQALERRVAERTEELAAANEALEDLRSGRLRGAAVLDMGAAPRSLPA